MNPPPFLLLGAVLIWGWQSQVPWLGLAIGILLEAMRLLPWRWQASVEVIKQWLLRVTWLCVFIMLALTLYLLNSHEHGSSSMPLVQWAPLALLPLAICLQATGLSQIDSSFMPQALKQASSAAQENRQPRAINLAYPWLAIWLLAASAASNQGAYFYWAAAACAAWALWHCRPRQSAKSAWLIMLTITILLGGGMHLALYQMQGVVEEWAMAWLSNRPHDDPIQSQTALGHIGDLKLSDQISLQVVPLKQGQIDNSLRNTPLLLMSASYNIYHNTTWKLTGNNSFVDLQAEQLATEKRWNLRSAAHSSNTQALAITAYSQQQHALVALPIQTSQIRVLLEHDSLTRLSRNPLGSVQGFMEPGYYRYLANYSNGNTAEQVDKPGQKELQLPEQERALLLQLAQQLQLAKQTPSQALNTLQTFFAQNFRYSTWRNGSGAGKSPLADFLTQNRSGHCEHFATASALLLRAAGIPSRYVVGYSVQEPNRFGDGYVVRQRHAHAWVRVYINQSWQDFDSTPANWLDLEEGSHWEILQDGRYWLSQQWRQPSKTEWALLLAVLSGGLLLSRVLRNKGGRWQGMQRIRRSEETPTEQQLGPLSEILQNLQQLGLGREEQEPLLHWYKRIAEHLQPCARQELQSIVEMYYLARFGPPQEKSAQLDWQAACLAWLQTWPASSASLSIEPIHPAD
mgnify:CR=1 FL=1